MGHAVAQQVLEGRGHAVEHPAIDLDRATLDVELDLAAGVLGGLPHHAVQAVGDALELDHSRAQQVALQLAGLARLRGQVVLGRFDGALKLALHRGDVVDRLGHHAGEFLHTGEAVELKRIEAAGRVLGLGQARLHLRFGLQLDVAQLGAQTIKVDREVVERAAQLAELVLQTRAGDHHLAGLVHEPV